MLMNERGGEWMSLLCAGDDCAKGGIGGNQVVEFMSIRCDSRVVFCKVGNEK